MKGKPKTSRLGGAHPENLFQRARLKAGLSQEDAAYGVPCPLRTLQRYEAGKTEPDYRILCGMIRCYKCEAADLFSDRPLPDEEAGGDEE